MTAEEKIKEINSYSEMIPGVVIIHKLPGFHPVYMSKNGFKNLGITLEELVAQQEEYHQNFFKIDEMKRVLPQIRQLIINGDPAAEFCFFQQVKLSGREDWVWHITSIKIFHQDEQGNVTHTLSVAFPVDRMKHISHKTERLLAETEFSKKNTDKYFGLGERAKEVLRLVALGKSSAEITEELSISVQTVQTHRKKIKQKLGITSTYDFREYAQAFNLI